MINLTKIPNQCDADKRDQLLSEDTLTLPKLKTMKVLLPVALACPLLIGCWEVTTLPAKQQEQKESMQQQAESVNASANNQQIAQSINTESVASSDNDVTANIYRFSEWNQESISPVSLASVTAKPEKLARVITVDENSLDFSSNQATKYRFMANDAPYFDLVDSKKFVELHWYYANKKDTAKEKKISVSHTKKVHDLARQVMGDAGGQLVESMVFGQVVKHQVINDIDVALAKCEFYSCMLVMKKNKVANVTTPDPNEESGGKTGTEPLIKTSNPTNSEETDKIKDIKDTPKDHNTNDRKQNKDSEQKGKADTDTATKDS